MASKYAEYDARAAEADKRIGELTARVVAMEKASSGGSGGSADDKKTIAALEKRVKQLEAQIEGMKKAAAGGGKKEKKAKEEKPKESKKDKKKADKNAVDPEAEKKLLKAALKEGGKKGQDIVGLQEMGGVAFFHIASEAALGRWDLMEAVMEGFNKEIDEEAEDRKGGAAHLCKALCSAGEKSLIMYVHVPADHKKILPEGVGETNAKEWAEAMLQGMGPKAKIIETKGDFTKVECPADPDANLFPLKMRDAAIGQGFAFLKKKNLVLDQDSDDDVDYGEMAAGADISWGGAGSDY